jgi:hypothetical protein
MAKEKDEVNHPEHYTWLEGLEVIDITEQLNFNLGNVLKYVLRCDHKHSDNGNTDLHKAAFYLEREIARRKRMQDNRRRTSGKNRD